MTDACIVLTTAGTLEEGQKIARAIVERRLAACVNIIPQMQSIYRWQGNVEQATECLLIIKTGLVSVQRVRDAITELHSYELPECIMFEITGGSPAYLDWLTQNIS